MKRIILCVFGLTMLGACAVDGEPRYKSFTSAACPSFAPARGYVRTNLKYKQDDIKMKWKSKGPQASEFRIRLKPRAAFKDALVTITGKSGTDLNGNPQPFAWLNVSGRFNNKKVLIACVPSGAPIGTEYKFDVEIEGVGTLDPRLKVVNK